MNLSSLGEFCSPLFLAAARMAASTGSWPPSALARAANAKTCASLKPDIGRTPFTDNSLRVKVPVLSEQSTSMVAASSTAERRVDSTPVFARDLAPSAVASVNVAGKATGMAASTAVSKSEMVSSQAMP